MHDPRSWVETVICRHLDLYHFLMNWEYSAWRRTPGALSLTHTNVSVCMGADTNVCVLIYMLKHAHSLLIMSRYLIGSFLPLFPSSISFTRSLSVTLSLYLSLSPLSPVCPRLSFSKGSGDKVMGLGNMATWTQAVLSAAYRSGQCT